MLFYFELSSVLLGYCQVFFGLGDFVCWVSFKGQQKKVKKNIKEAYIVCLPIKKKKGGGEEIFKV